MNTSEILESRLEQLYQHRFPAEIIARRSAVWKVLCRDWFAQYVAKTDRVIEVAAGYCEFINNIEAAERIAVDINPETARFAGPGVTVHQVTAEKLAGVVPARHFDVVFMSNFLEHCRSRDEILKLFHVLAGVLKPGGRLLILGPNFRYCYKDYFDFFDHHLPLTDKAIVEALSIADFKIEVAQPRTLPFSFKSRLPTWPWLVRLYLQFPIVWSLVGAQFFIVARTAGPGGNDSTA